MRSSVSWKAHARRQLRRYGLNRTLCMQPRLRYGTYPKLGLSIWQKACVRQAYPSAMATSLNPMTFLSTVWDEAIKRGLRRILTWALGRICSNRAGTFGLVWFATSSHASAPCHYEAMQAVKQSHL